jgi:hypothetical protein
MIEHIKTAELEQLFDSDQCRSMVHLSSKIREVISFDMYVDPREQVDYWQARVNHELEKDEAIKAGLQEPIFVHNDAAELDVQVEDAHRRERLLRLHARTSASTGILDIAEYGISESRILADRQIIDKHFKQNAYDLNLQNSRDFIDDSIRRFPLIARFIGADVLETISLMDGNIRKANIPPTMLAAIGSIMHTSLLEIIANSSIEDHMPRLTFKPTQVESSAGKIVEDYNGTVSSLEATKLPVTEEFIEGYFIDPTAIFPQTVTRIQFEAALKPTGKQPAISILHTTIFQALDKRGEPRIQSAIKRQDKFAAQYVINSLRRESSATQDVVNSNLTIYSAGGVGTQPNRKKVRG